MKLIDIRRAYALANTLYGIEPDDFEETALYAWDLINCRHTHLYRIIANTDSENKIELPCNVDIIKSVHLPLPDAANSEDWSELDRDSIIIERYIDANKHFEDPEFTRGKLAKYIEENNTLYFSHPYKNVMIVYKGIICDEDSGLPLVTEKEAQAIAAFIAYTALYKDGIQRRDMNSINLAKDIYNNWLRLCNRARVIDEFSDNDLDKILDAKTNWNRKVYSKSYTPVS